MLHTFTIQPHREDYTLSSGRYVVYSEADVTLEVEVTQDCWDYPGDTTISVSEVAEVRAEIKVGDEYVAITDLTEAEIAEMKKWFEAQEYGHDDLPEQE